MIFTPFEIRAGYFHYGGSDYLKGFPIFGGDLSQHPIQVDSTHFSYTGLEDLKDRNGLFFEVDIAKINAILFVVPQNVIDVQFGLGYRTSHMLSRPQIPTSLSYEDPEAYWNEYKFYPKIHDFNFNTTISWQFNEIYIPYLYHSVGASKISLLRTESNDKYLYGDAVSETVALGVKKIIKEEKDKRYNLYYGAEIKSIRTTSTQLRDENKFSPITGFDMRGISFNVTFGVVFGGRRTAGDRAFSMLIENEFESAIPAFEEYIEKYPRHGRIKKAKKMLEFCKSQIPYDKYQQGVDELSEQNIDQTITMFDEAYIDADDDLKFEIDLKKDVLSNQIIDYIDLNFNDLPLKKSEVLIDRAEQLSQSVSDEARVLRGKIFFKRATLLHESGLYNDALDSYRVALSLDSGLTVLINSRLLILVNSILEKSKSFHENNDYVLAVESLKKAIEIIPDLRDRFLPKIEEFQYIINELNNAKTHQAIQNVLYENQHKGKSKRQLVVGMLKDKVIDLMGMPDSIDFLESHDNLIEVWVYLKSNEKLYIKDEQLYRIHKVEG